MASAAFAETGVSVEIEVSVGSWVETEIEASAASEAFPETAAFERGKRAVDLEAMSLLARPVGNNIEANEAALVTRES